MADDQDTKDEMQGRLIGAGAVLGVGIGVGLGMLVGILRK
jgi:hypothetical protein